MVVRFRITTPEQVSFHYQVAGLISRMMAWIIDEMALLAALSAAWAVSFQLGEIGAAAMFIIRFILNFGYYVFFEMRWAGQSPGKRLFGLRVISTRGGRLSFHDSLVRNLMRLVDFPIPFTPIGALGSCFDPLNRRPGDRVSETLVVRDVKLAVPPALTRQQARVNSFQADAAVRGRIQSRVTKAERNLMFELMFRRDEFEPSAREEIFRQAAEHFRRRYALPADLEHLSDEQTVLNVALVVQEAKFVLPATIAAAKEKAASMA